MTESASLGYSRVLRKCVATDNPTILAIINEAAIAYRDAIPADRWHDPYMSMEELQNELVSGVVFWGYEIDGELIGVMGIQPVKDVDLIRHAYVRRSAQRGGVGAALLEFLRTQAERPILVGTWGDATWAIGFYQRNGFDLVSAEETPALLRKYWSIPERQIETSVVLRNSRT